MKRLLALAFGLCSMAHAQNTTVTASVVDNDGQAWLNGTFSASIVLPGGTFSGTKPSVGGVAVAQPVTGYMDANGVISVSLVSTNTLDQSGGQWAITACPNATTQQFTNGCYTVTTAVTGTTLNLSSQFASIPAPRFPAGTNAYGYRDSEIIVPTQPGLSYYNTGNVPTTQGLRLWNGAAWAGVGAGSGGAGFNYRGVYSTTLTYAANDMVTEAGIGYYSIGGGNINHDPATTSGYWQALGQVGPGNALQLTGGTMTGPLILNADPASPTQAATKSYVDTHFPTGPQYKLGAYTGTGSGSAYALGNFNATTDSTGNNLTLPGALSTKVDNGTYKASRAATTPGVSNDGVANLLAGPCASGNCSIEIEPNYVSASLPLRSAAPPQLSIHSLFASGTEFWFRHNWGDAANNVNGFGAEASTRWFRFDGIKNEPPHYGRATALSNMLNHTYEYSYVPGLNYGSSGSQATQYGIFNSAYEQVDSQIYSQGIYSYQTGNISKLSDGDFNGVNLYYAHAGGHKDASAEGFAGIRVQVQNAKGWSIPLSAPIGSDWLVHTNGGGGEDGLGTDRPLLNGSHTISVNITSCANVTTHPQGYSSCTLAAALPTAWQSSCQNISADIVQHNGTGNTPEANLDNLRTSMDITLPSVTGLTVGEGFTIADGNENTDIHYPETSVITAITGNVITANLNYAHRANATACFGGVAGGGFATNDAVSTAVGKWPVFVIGAPDSTHLILGYPMQGTVSGFGNTGNTTLYTGTVIADVRNPATGVPDGSVFRVADFAPAVAWVAGDSIFTANSPAVSQHMIRLNDANGNPFSDGSFIDVIDNGFTGGIGNKNGGGGIITQQSVGPQNYKDHGGLFYPKDVYLSRGINGNFYSGYVPELSFDNSRTLLHVRGYAPGNTYQGQYSIWDDATGGDGISYLPSTHTMYITPAKVNFNNTITAAYGNFFRSVSGGSLVSLDNQVNSLYNRTGGVFLSRWSFDHATSLGNSDYTYSWIEGGGSNNGSSGSRYLQFGIGDGISKDSGTEAFRLDDQKNVHLYAPNGCAGSVAGDFVMGCPTSTSNAVAKINVISGAANFTTLTVGSGAVSVCQQNGANCPTTIHSLSWNVQPGVFATSTALGAVYFEPNNGTANMITARLSGTVSCTVAPSVVLLDLGTAATTAYASATVVYTLATGTTAGAYVPASFGTPPTTTAGHYYGIGFSAGTCTTAPTVDVTLTLH